MSAIDIVTNLFCLFCLSDLGVYKITDTVFIGDSDSLRKPEHLTAVGITAVLNVEKANTIFGRKCREAGIEEWKECLIPDDIKSEHIREVRDAVKGLSELQAKSKRTVVCDTAAMGRSPLVATAYLFLEMRKVAEQAVAIVKEGRPKVFDNEFDRKKLAIYCEMVRDECRYVVNVDFANASIEGGHKIHLNPYWKQLSDQSKKRV